MRMRSLVFAVVVLVVASLAWASYDISGTAADTQTFLAMLTKARDGSAAFKREYDVIFADGNHKLHYNVGRNQANQTVYTVDNFQTNEVNLNDLEKFPDKPPAGHPNAITRGQLIKHFMAERYQRATNAGSEKAKYKACHATAITAENELRTEAGQPTIVDPPTYSQPGADGSYTATINYTGGGSETWSIAGNGAVTGVAYH